jgi:hypothetical protein
MAFFPFRRGFAAGVCKKATLGNPNVNFVIRGLDPRIHHSSQDSYEA